ncbi:MAG: hypothetical protein PVH83_09420, partial [Methyloceanibacter sp.]
RCLRNKDSDSLISLTSASVSARIETSLRVLVRVTIVHADRLRPGDIFHYQYGAEALRRD